MVKLRLRKGGKKNSLYFRIVAVDERKKNSGTYLDLLGSYNPAKKDFKIDQEKVNLWLKKGAVISAGLKKLLEQKKK